MKRAIFAGSAATLLGCLSLGACSPPSAPRTADARAASAPGWTRPPSILSVQREQGALVFSGAAEPGARVVLRSAAGAAYAVAADADGRFEIRMAAPAGDLLLRPETQLGQDAAPSPDQLLIVAGGRGPIAVLRTGGPTRRLDPAPALGAVDSDGRMRLASGQTAEGGARVSLAAAGETGEVVSDAAGRWRLVLPPSAAPEEIRVGGDAFIWPGEGSAGASTRVERAGRGWRVVWSGPDGADQTTWLPDGA